MRSDMEDWERRKIRKLLWCVIASGGLGGLAVVGLLHLFAAIGWGPMSSGILALPWVIAIVVVVPMAYREGVRDERQHAMERDGGPPVR